MDIKYIQYLSGVINESQFLGEGKGGGLKNYMFFSNLRTIKEKVDKLLAMDAKELDARLSDGHDWANDHIATSKDDMEEVYNWASGRGKD